MRLQSAEGPSAANALEDALIKSQRQHAMPPSGEQKRIPELDGLRGIAILMVLAFHYSTVLGALNGPAKYVRAVLVPGWTGVDLFFVLSGFLITGILLQAREHPNYFRNFYAKRVIRIFPVYYVALALCLTAARAADPSFSITPVTAFAYILHVSNWLSPSTSEIGFINHFWSLAVEEQFYVCWPVVVWFLSRRRLTAFCLFLFAAAPLLRYLILAGYLGGVDAPAQVRMAFVLTPARADTLAMGALAALAVDDCRCRHFIARFGGILSIAIATAAVGWYALKQPLQLDRPLPQAFRASLMGLTYLALLLQIVIAKPAAAGILNWPLLRSAGKYSYGAYVFHFPILSATLFLLGDSTRIPWVAWSCFFTGFAVVFSVAVLSWNMIEKRMLMLKSRFEQHGAAHRVNC